MSEQTTSPRYSVSDIMAMRMAVAELMTSWQYQEDGRCGSGPKSEDVEDQVRTYIAAGTRPEELQAEARKRDTEAMQTLEEAMRYLRELSESA